MPEQYFTTKEIAESLRLSLLQVRNLIKSGQLAAYRVGHRSYRIKESDFNSFLESRKQPVIQE